MSVTPAAEMGSTSTMRSTTWSRIAWIGKSVTRVRANSLRTAESCWSLGTGHRPTKPDLAAGTGRDTHVVGVLNALYGRFGSQAVHAPRARRRRPTRPRSRRSEGVSTLPPTVGHTGTMRYPRSDNHSQWF